MILAALAGAWNDNFGSFEWGLRLVLAVALSAVAIFVAWIRVRNEHALRHMTVIAETAQRAVLRAMPTAVESVGFAARYISATEEALVGGDLYEVVASPHGVRVIVGDVRGKGLEAVQMAALLAEFHEDHTVTLVNCGHHPPLLVTQDGVVHLPAAAAEPAPPLGLSPAPMPVSSSWPPGSRLLLYTDGLVEARNRNGTFFPLDEHASELQQGSLREALDRLVDALVTYTGHRVTDDMALVVAENRWS